MGTSKGYIAPSTPHWSQAKRQLTSYISNQTSDNRRNVVRKYANAIITEGFDNSRVVINFSNFANFAFSTSSVGYQHALEEIGRNDILNMNSEDALNELMYYFANDCITIDDKITLDCIAETLSILEIKQPEDLKNIETNTLIKVLVCQFAKFKFAQLFDKQIRNKDPINADKIILDMQDYIYYTMENSLTNESLSSINPQNLAEGKIVKEIIEQAFNLMKEFYGE